MKHAFLSLILSTLLFTCSKNDIDKNCNFLLNIGVSTSINLSLPQYSQLQFTSNSVYVANAGNGGVIVTNSGTGYLAWDASDPNHVPSSCSRLNVSGLEAKCGCTDENLFSLITGQPLGNGDLRCGLKAYRVEQSGNTLIITN